MKEFELNDKDFEVPRNFEDMIPEESRESNNSNMLDPNGKNIFTWVIGILTLAVVSVSSGITYMYKQLLDEKDNRIKQLESRDCKEEIKNYLELQKELLRDADQSTKELKSEVREKLDEIND